MVHYHRQRHQNSSVEHRLLDKHIELTREIRDNAEVAQGSTKYTRNVVAEMSRMCRDMVDTERRMDNIAWHEISAMERLK